MEASYQKRHQFRYCYNILMEFAYNIVTESKFDVWARAIFKMFADCMRAYKWLPWKLKFECSSTVRDKFGIEKCEHTQEHSMFTKDNIV